MNVLDIILGCLLLYSVYSGLKNGLFVELASLLALIVGIYVTIKFSAVMRDFLVNAMSWSPKYISVVAFALTFLVVVVCIHLCAKIFTGVASFAYLGWLNKLAGAIFSLLKTILILSIVLNLFQKINVNGIMASKETLDASVFYNPIQEISAYIFPSLEKLFYESMKDLKK